MTWELKNVGWPVPISSWDGTVSTKHRIEPAPILEPYKIVVVPLYGNSYFYTETYKGLHVNFYA